MSDLLEYEINDYDDLLAWEGLARAEIATLRAECDAAVARAEAAEAKWRPIADAPRDGSRVLLWYPELRLNDSPPRIFPALVAEGFFDVLIDKVWMLSRGNGRIDHRIRAPTYWRPLPAGPKQG